MASRQTSGAAALRYATALVDTAVEAGSLDAVEQDLKDFEGMLSASEDLQNLICSPLIKRGQQRDAMVAVAQKAKFNSLTQNFLALLAENHRLNIISAIISAVKTDMSRRRGEVVADVQAAFALSDLQTKALKDALGKATGKNISLNVEIDRDLIGGMVVTVGSKMIDDSVKRKLERLERAMKSSSNTNVTNKTKQEKTKQEKEGS